MLVPGLGDLLVFACRPDKKPLIDAWPERAQRIEPPQHWPLVGAITGPRNGYDVLDVECAGLEWLQATPLPRTRTHQTPRGWHLLFCAAEGLTGSNDLRIHKDVHIRAAGNYHVFWPRQGYAVVDAPLAEWPEDLLKLAKGGDHITSPASHTHIARAVLRDQSASDTIGKLDPINFREYTQWLHLMMGCHAAGISREDFVAWSVSDPLYANAGGDIRNIWNALKVEGNANGRISEATLFAALRKQPERCVMPAVPKHRRKMSRVDIAELSRMSRWLSRQREDEGALFWTACRYGGWRMEYVVSDRVLEDMLVAAAWQAGLRNKDRVLRQVRNGMRIGALEWMDRTGHGGAHTSSGLFLTAMGEHK
jgi:hypothetical protein